MVEKTNDTSASTPKAIKLSNRKSEDNGSRSNRRQRHCKGNSKNKKSTSYQSTHIEKQMNWNPTYSHMDQTTTITEKGCADNTEVFHEQEYASAKYGLGVKESPRKKGKQGTYNNPRSPGKPEDATGKVSVKIIDAEERRYIYHKHHNAAAHLQSSFGDMCPCSTTPP